MISIHELTDEQLKSVIDWMEHPAALEIVLPRVLKLRNDLVATLIADHTDCANANIVRGKLRLLNQFLDLHDVAFGVVEENEAQQETELDKPPKK